MPSAPLAPPAPPAPLASAQKRPAPKNSQVPAAKRPQLAATSMSYSEIAVMDNVVLRSSSNPRLRQFAAQAVQTVASILSTSALQRRDSLVVVATAKAPAQAPATIAQHRYCSKPLARGQRPGLRSLRMGWFKLKHQPLGRKTAQTTRNGPPTIHSHLFVVLGMRTRKGKP